MEYNAFDRPRVVLLGNAGSIEMRVVREGLEKDLHKTDLRSAGTLDEVFRLIREENWYPDLGIVLQNFPDEFAAAPMHRLLGLLPLTRWVCCYGAWCEADGRTRKVWPESQRVPLRDAGDRIYRELVGLRVGESPLPLTASLEETLLHEWLQDSASSSESCQQVEIISPDAAFQAMLADVLRQRTIPVSVTDADIRLWDVDPLSPETLNAIEQFHRTSPRTKLIAMMTQPYPEDYHRLAVRGVSKVIPKLISHNRLFQVLEELSPVNQKAA